MSHSTKPGKAIRVEAIGMSMRFGPMLALDDVSITIEPGSFHALLGENGAGKSTLVKCMMGFQKPSTGALVVDGRERTLADPRTAHALGMGMVYQHFTLAPSLTGAENLLISRERIPTLIDWATERRAIESFIETMPFRVPIDQPVSRYSAGEKQKLEILKQLYLGRRFLVLDEPTSVMTPQEADEVLGMVRQMTRDGRLSVLMITHKLREVTAFADTVTVLRRARRVGSGRVGELDEPAIAQMMVGSALPSAAVRRDTPAGEQAPVVLEMHDIEAADRSGLRPIRIASLKVHAGEIVGIAGVSGNGQNELVELLTGERPLRRGSLRVHGRPYRQRRDEAQALGIRFVPEEPLASACAPGMTVAQNLAYRIFDGTGTGRRRIWLDRAAMRDHARRLIDAYGVRAASTEVPMASLSGGNVQRAVLARELDGRVNLLIVVNPCFGLDFSAVREIRDRIIAARNQQSAVLLISEDLDEVMELADRIIVMAAGQAAHETLRADADLAQIGRHMAGQGT